jgi:hypothetical protein
LKAGAVVLLHDSLRKITKGECTMTGREKWRRFLCGENVGPMVSPLCDKWGTDIPYRWSLSEPEPFGPNHNNHTLSQQIMMAEYFEWDPLFLAGIHFESDVESRTTTKQENMGSGVTRVTTTITTPLGDLIQVEEKTSKTSGIVKDFLQNADDFKKMIWITEQQMHFDESDALRQGQEISEAVGSRGMLGTWVSPCAILADIQVLFFHAMDFPQEFQALYEVRKTLLRKQIETYHKAGFDYLFYTIPGTEWLSPAFFDAWMNQEIGDTIAYWRSLGGFTVWHTCGLEKTFMEQGIYQRLKPDIFETLSEPPVGNLPSLAWGRKQLPKDIITKGNIPLDIALYGTPDEVRAQVRYVKESTQGYRHIIGFSDNILDNTPYDNLKAFVEEARK